MRFIILFFFYTKSSKPNVYVTLTARHESPSLSFKGSVATCGSWLPCRGQCRFLHLLTGEVRPTWLLTVVRGSQFSKFMFSKCHEMNQSVLGSLHEWHLRRRILKFFNQSGAPGDFSV